MAHFQALMFTTRKCFSTQFATGNDSNVTRDVVSKLKKRTNKKYFTIWKLIQNCKRLAHKNVQFLPFDKNEGNVDKNTLFWDLENVEL